jgi:hypothetical protein
MKSRKGFTGIELVILVAVCLIGAVFAAPKIGEGVHNIVNGGQNQKKATVTRQLERTYYVPDEKHPGKFIADHTDKLSEASFSLDATQPPETLWQKFLHLGIMIIPVIILISYLGAWPLVNYWVSKIRAKVQAAATAHEQTLSDTKMIVKSVDEGLGMLNSAIAAAKAQYDASVQSMTLTAGISDPTQRQAAIDTAQHAQMVAQAVVTALSNLKDDFLAAMSRKQDATTKALVAKLKLQ